MEWRFKENAEPQGSSDGFWYDLTSGGYIRPAEVLKDEKQVEQINDAIKLLQSFEQALEDNNLLNEF